MHQIQLNEQVYQEAQRRASEAGFSSVDEYVTELLQHGFEETENLDHLFTPERLAHIDCAIAEIDAGLGLTSEQAKAELAKRREEWLRQNPR
ncbi:MAG: hypothetical protein JSS27_12405 [Planctomycetes bacterium]|nr:hypothetical protein [Planctomycetota bacterium]